MSSVAVSQGPIHLGLDVSKNKIAVGILPRGERTYSAANPRTCPAGPVKSCALSPERSPEVPRDQRSLSLGCFLAFLLESAVASDPQVGQEASYKLSRL